MRRNTGLLTLSALLLTGLGVLASEAQAQQQWPGCCEANYCMGEPIGSCGYYCKIGGSGHLCMTNSPIDECNGGEDPWP